MIDKKVCICCGAMYNGGLGNCPKCNSPYWMTVKKAERDGSGTRLQERPSNNIPEGWAPAKLTNGLYVCNPALNKDCNKRDCRTIGGCYATLHEEFAEYIPKDMTEQPSDRGKRELTIPEKLDAMIKIIPEKMSTITRIDFPKDGRVLVWYEGQILQIPKWKLEEV